jgi:putative ABC transport system permease protein
MLRNFFKTAGRNILKYKAYSLINFLGLTTGLALAILIFAYVRSEMSYDKFHEKTERLYRIRYTAPNGLEIASSPPSIAPVMKDFFPEVEEAGRMYRRNVSITRMEGEETFEEPDIYFADSTIMNMFSFQFVSGNPKRALADKFTVLITEEMAKKYFGDKDPLGESLLFSGKHSFRITGVVKNFPKNSHLRFNMLVPYENMFDLESDQAAQALRNNLAINFIISHSYTYVLLKPGADPSNVDRNMEAFLKKYAQPNLLVGQVFRLMPLTDIHLKSTLMVEPTPTNSWTNLYIFIGVGILTLVIAAINYINLSTAQSFTRIKEIGIRKILGSMKGQLITQFVAESFIFCIISVILSFAVFYAVLPLLNGLTDKTLAFGEVVDGGLLVTAFLLVIFITLLAGGYPAYFVTQFNSINSLKGEGTGRQGKQWLRKGLVIFQLSIACMLMSGSLLIMKQLNFLSDRPLGFQKDHTINIPLFSQNLNGIFRQNDSTFWVRLQSFRDVIETQSGVKGTALSSNAPGLGVVFRGTVPEGFTQQDNMFIANLSVDYDFLKTYGMELVAGRTFSKDFGTDLAEGFIVNETAVGEFKWETPEKAIGKKIVREGKEGRVIGVIRDFNFTSMTTPVSAMVLEISPNQYNTLSVKFENAEVQTTIDRLEKEWGRMFPEKTFQFTFLDEQLQRKIKEIGVRKVLGAGIGSILRLIYQDFAWLLAIGFIVAIPMSYYFMNQWLQNFTYRTSIDMMTYLISFSLVVLVVGLTIAYQALLAAMANPVKSLRSE